MKQIKITADSTPAITSLILAVEGLRTSVNCLSAAEVASIAAYAETSLTNLGIAKKDRAGATLFYVPAGPSASSYRYAQGATTLRIIRRAAGWYVTEIHRTEVYPKNPERRNLTLTEKQDVIAVAALRNRYTVTRPVATA